MKLCNKVLVSVLAHSCTQEAGASVDTIIPPTLFDQQTRQSRQCFENSTA